MPARTSTYPFSTVDGQQTGTHDSDTLFLKDILDNIRVKEHPGNRVVCLLDCHGLPFSQQFVHRGRNGGLDAARKLASCIKNSDYIDENTPFTVLTYAFLDKQVLALENNAATVDAFMVGLNHGSEPTHALDFGGSRQLVVTRIMELLLEHLQAETTTKIVLGGCTETIYCSALEALDAQLLDDKLLLLRGPSGLPFALKGYGSIKAPLIFEAKSTGTPTAASAAGGVTSAIGARQTSSPPMSQEEGDTSWETSPSESSLKTPSSAGTGRYLDPNIHPNKHNPPPCEMHYLLGRCKRGCQNGHDYILSEQDLTRMREYCKSRPCDSVWKETVCTFGDRCLFGHTCSWGEECKYFAEGRCAFGGAAYHQGDRVERVGSGTQSKPVSPVNSEPKFSQPRPNPFNTSSGCEWRTVRARRATEGSTSSPTRALLLDPRKYINDHDPRPCNHFYILGNCTRRTCKFSHDYILREGELEKLKSSARYTPCGSLQKGGVCTLGETCMFGHTCPWGMECRYLQEGTCGFGGESRHKAEEEL